MATAYLSVNNILRPQILVSEKDFLVAYKPPRMHSAPLSHSSSDNLLSWCTGKVPEIADLPGRRAGEGGLLHRLDFETHGLLLLAKTQRGMENFIEQQKNGNIIKEYCALASASKTVVPGFPQEKSELVQGLFSAKEKDRNFEPVLVKSAFRSYGFGRKAVRPVRVDDVDGLCPEKPSFKDIVFDDGNPYITNIIETYSLSYGVVSFRLRIFRGFRHQLRCHLAWLRSPILNDSLYGGSSYGKSLLGLRAQSLSFKDPSSGRERTYTIRPLELDEL